MNTIAERIAASAHRIEGGLRLVYQPRVDLQTLRSPAVEALVRLSHPRLGMLPAGDFIPQAELSGDILRIGAWVLNEGVRQAGLWQRAGRAVKLAINVSALQVSRGRLLPELRGALARHAVPADLIELEITESLEVEDPVAASQTMGALRDMGVDLAIDDFGKGYSGMTTLSWLPASVVKIDKSFIDGLRPRPGPADDLLGAMVAFAHRLGALCVAEGVEAQWQAVALRALGCDQAQGYFFSPPVDQSRLPGNYSNALAAPMPELVEPT
jgi:diguanylate cyclase